MFNDVFICVTFVWFVIILCTSRGLTLLYTHTYSVTYVYDVFICATFMWFVILGVLQQDFVHVCASVLEQFIGPIEDDQGDLAVTKNAQFVSLLHQAELPLCKRHLKVTE